MFKLNSFLEYNQVQIANFLQIEEFKFKTVRHTGIGELAQN